MSALPPKAHIRYGDQHVRLVPKAEMGERKNRKAASQWPFQFLSDCLFRLWLSPSASPAPASRPKPPRPSGGWPATGVVTGTNPLSGTVLLTRQPLGFARASQHKYRSKGAGHRATVKVFDRVYMHLLKGGG